jgi:hypothetical protein
LLCACGAPEIPEPDAGDAGQVWYGGPLYRQKTNCPCASAGEVNDAGLICAPLCVPSSYIGLFSGTVPFCRDTTLCSTCCHWRSFDGGMP